ncbi:ead/Ea22-like family protein [Pseudomonas aeruginosa]
MDTNKLKELAERARDKGDWYKASSVDAFPEFHVDQEFMVATSPDVVLWLIAEVEQLRSRLEIDERIPHDGIACRDETIKALDEKCYKLKAENDALRGALQAVVDDPTWRSNDNTLWPKIIKAMDKGTTK